MCRNQKLTFKFFLLAVTISIFNSFSLEKENFRFAEATVNSTTAIAVMGTLKSSGLKDKKITMIDRLVPSRVG